MGSLLTGFGIGNSMRVYTYNNTPTLMMMSERGAMSRKYLEKTFRFFFFDD